MPFDSSKPADHSPLVAAEMRGQLNGLKELIDQAVAGGITSVVVDSVTTLNPGEPATVMLSITGTVLHMSFAFPQGQPGVQGLQGAPFANVVIDGVTTLDPAENASVSVSFDGTNIHLSFAIPRGAPGEQGLLGPTGEVSNAALASTMDTPFTNDPPTLADLELMRVNYNQLLLTLRR